MLFDGQQIDPKSSYSNSQLFAKCNNKISWAINLDTSWITCISIDIVRIGQFWLILCFKIYVEVCIVEANIYGPWLWILFKGQQSIRTNINGTTCAEIYV